MVALIADVVLHVADDGIDQSATYNLPSSSISAVSRKLGSVDTRRSSVSVPVTSP
jgi:hypothetical protein